MEGLKILEKKCTKCGLVLPVDLFYKDGRRNNSTQSRCKNCAKIYYKANRKKIGQRAKSYYQDNKEKINEYQKAYDQVNREKINKRVKTYNQSRKEKRKEYQKEYRKANKEKISEHKKAYYQASKEKIGNRLRKRRKADPSFAAKDRIRSRILCAVKRQFTEKSHKTKELLGCDYATFKRHFEKQFTEGMTWDLFMQGKIHIDHIVPCAKFDLKDEQQQRACFHYKNLQPLWATDNLSKGDKILEPAQMVLGI